MKVVVIGGTGVFGERLVRLLLRDGHQVVVVGRGAAAWPDLGLNWASLHWCWTALPICPRSGPLPRMPL